jgi:hypothetical protein
MQENIDLRKIWDIWTSGESVSNYYLNGVKILWIGRTGKVIGFISALTIIIDIVGVDKAKEFGESARKLISGRFFVKVIPNYLITRYARLRSWLINDLLTLRNVSIWGIEDSIYGVFSGSFSGYSINWLPYKLFSDSLPSITAGILFLILVFVFLFVSAPAIFGVILVLPALFVLILDVLIEVIAFFLVKDQRVKVIALFCLISGFILDFLSS